jgi:hypothetical protein
MLIQVILLACILSLVHASLPTNLDASSLPSSRGVLIEGPSTSASQNAGSAVRVLGDINKDGIDDYAVGAKSGSFGSRQYCGLTYVMYGSHSMSGTIDLGTVASSAGYQIIGEGSNDFSGSVIGSADVNKDGFKDILVGVQETSPTVGGVQRARAGTTYVIYGKASRTTNVDLAALTPADGFKIFGAVASDFSGNCISSAGDINQDGFEDFIIGASQANRLGRGLAGVAYVLFGKANFGVSIDLAALTSNDGFQITGAIANGYVGNAVSSAGDFNKDGVDDFVIGSYLDGPNHQGVAYVFFGKKTGSFSNVDLATFSSSSSVGVRILGESSGDQLGFSVASAGDFNGDGINDLVIGANFVDPDPHISNAGAAYVIYGKAVNGADIQVSRTMSSFGVAIYGASTNYNLGYSVSGGDFDQDGYSDVLLGANQQGVAYVISGKSASAVSSLFTSSWDSSWGYFINGVATGDNLGSSVDMSGDINGDGMKDALVAAPMASPNGRSHAGAVYALTGSGLSQTPTISPSPAPSVTPSEVPSTNPTVVPSREPTPVPSGEPTPVPSREPTPVPSREPTPVPSTEPTPVPSGEPTPVPSREPTPVPSREPTPVPSGEPTPVPSGEPTPVPSREPTPVPSREPTPVPSREPTPVASGEPTPVPSREPTPVPSREPTPVPSGEPTPVPSTEPTPVPSGEPTPVPSREPTPVPSREPTVEPSIVPTVTPSKVPTTLPTTVPSEVPSLEPTAVPSVVPTRNPSGVPTAAPTAVPSASPTTIPSEVPSTDPTAVPSAEPTFVPSAEPTFVPSAEPTFVPSAEPTFVPSAEPTFVPSIEPTFVPSAEPTFVPSAEPTFVPSAEPTFVPSVEPTFVPSTEPTFVPSVEPTFVPSAEPTFTPSEVPTAVPSDAPTNTPNSDPSVSPTIAPTHAPTTMPSIVPTEEPTTVPTVVPSATPSAVPSVTPSEVPTAAPTAVPTFLPSASPSAEPSVLPTKTPTSEPTMSPTREPTHVPTAAPSAEPSVSPTAAPTQSPSAVPSAGPTVSPTNAPTMTPTFSPSVVPTVAPTSSGRQIVYTLTMDLTGVATAELTTEGKKAMENTIAELTGLPVSNVILVRTVSSTPVESALRKRLRSEATTYMLKEEVLSKVDMGKDYDPGTQLELQCNNYQQKLATYITDGSLQVTLRAKAALLGASELSNVIIPHDLVITYSTCKNLPDDSNAGVDSNSSATSQLAMGYVAAICTVTLFFVAMCLCCLYLCLYVYREKSYDKADENKEVEMAPPSRHGKDYLSDSFLNESSFTGIYDCSDAVDNTVLVFLSSSEDEVAADAFGFVPRKRQVAIEPTKSNNNNNMSKSFTKSVMDLDDFINSFSCDSNDNSRSAIGPTHNNSANSNISKSFTKSVMDLDDFISSFSPGSSDEKMKLPIYEEEGSSDSQENSETVRDNSSGANKPPTVHNNAVNTLLL